MRLVFARELCGIACTPTEAKVMEPLSQICIMPQRKSISQRFSLALPC